jgi:hypothetical protein
VTFTYIPVSLKALALVVSWLWLCLGHNDCFGAEPPIFTDVTTSSGVKFRNEASHTSQKYLTETMGGGVAMLDYDRDGNLDLFFVNGAALADPMPQGGQADKTQSRYWNRLYRNRGDGTFADVTEQAGLKGRGYGMGAVVGDYDNDGWPDLYLTNYGTNILYRNRGDGTFADVTARSGVAGGGWSAGAAFVDYDRDGHLDLIVARYMIWDYTKNVWCGERAPAQRTYCHPDQFAPATPLVYRNDGDGTFTDESSESGLAVAGKGLGIAVNDFDGDGWPDVFIANDSVAQQLFRNQGGVTFQEVGLLQGIGYNQDGRVFAGMGAAFADYDNDGRADIFVNALSRQGYSLFNNQAEFFEDVSVRSGITKATLQNSGWGTKFFDYDNDGWKDLLVGQGHVMDNIELTQPDLRYLQPLLLMRNNKGAFVDVSKQGGPSFLKPLAARGVAVGDLNNDGLLDVAINCNDQPAVILRNESGRAGHWLSINLIGGRSNRDGMGAKIRVLSESGLEQYGYVSTAGSYVSSHDKRVHFGLGADDKALLVEVTWPSGTQQRIENVAADQVLSVNETEARTR